MYNTELEELEQEIKEKQERYNELLKRQHEHKRQQDLALFESRNIAPGTNIVIFDDRCVCSFRSLLKVWVVTSISKEQCYIEVKEAHVYESDFRQCTSLSINRVSFDELTKYTTLYVIDTPALRTLQDKIFEQDISKSTIKTVEQFVYKVALRVV